MSTTNGVDLSVIEMCCPVGQSYESLSSTLSPRILAPWHSYSVLCTWTLCLHPSLSNFFLVILLVYQAACLTCFSLDMLGERQSQLINSGCIIKIKNNNTEKGLLSDTHLLRGCLQALLLCFFYGRNTVEKGDNPVFPRDVHISLTKMFPKLPRLEYFYQHHVQQQSRNLYLAKQCTGKTQNNIKHTHCKGK